MMRVPILLQTPAPSSSQTHERFFEWGTLPPAWVVFLVVLPLVIFLVSYFYRREKPASGSGARWVLGGLRAVILLAVLAMLARPLLREIVYQTRDPLFQVLVDDSISMAIKDKYADRSIPQRLGELFRSSPENVEHMSRYDLVARVLRDKELQFLESLRERGRVALWTFSGGLKKLGELPRKKEGQALAAGTEVGLPDYDKVQGEERVKQTRLGDALLEAVAGARGPLSGRDDQAIACTVLFSDGQHNSGTMVPEDVAKKLGQRGVPVYAVGVGNPESPKDIKVLSVDSSDVVLVGDRVSFDATVVADGFEGERVKVELWFDSERADTQYLNLSGHGERQTVRLEHTPTAKGDATATVKVEVSPGELLEENNVFSKPIAVLDQKIKVLYLEGPPRWEYRFLKNALLRDTTMEVQVLLYSADRDFIQESSPGIPPLRSFPAAREDLFQYHVVIIGDVDPDAISQEERELLKDFVSEAGGGVVFIAGEIANPARYLHTPLYQLLPVEVPDAAQAGRELLPTDSFNVMLTGVGKEHPALRLDNDPQRNTSLWQDSGVGDGNHLPAFLSWYAQVNREKSGAVKLAVHPRHEHPIYGPRVIFAFQNFGKGRTFFSAVDTTWRWRAGVDNLYFYKFWGQVIRFMAGGRLMGKTQRHQIFTDKPTYTIGEKITIDCRIYDANMKPSTEETLKVYHQVESGEGAGRKGPETLTLALSKVKGSGSYEGTITAGDLGRHELWVGTETERLAARGFTVVVPDLEYRDTRMNRDRLKKVAELSGGRYYDLPQIGALVKDLEGMGRPRQTPIDDRQDDLWDNFWVLLLITCLLATEWIYRKMVKLL